MADLVKNFSSLVQFNKYIAEWKASSKPLMYIKTNNKMFLALDSDQKSGSFCVLQLFENKAQCRIFLLTDKKATVLITYKNPARFRKALPITKWVASQRNKNAYFQNNQDLYTVAIKYAGTTRDIALKSPYDKSVEFKTIKGQKLPVVPQNTQITENVTITKPIPEYLIKGNDLCKGLAENELMTLRALIQSKINKLYSDTIFNK